MSLPSQNILHSLQLLQQVLHNRLQDHFKKEKKDHQAIFPSVHIKEDDSSLHAFIIDNKLSIEEYITILIALAPHIHPTLFENCIQEFLPQGGSFPEFGGVNGSNHRGVLPTGETVLFILCGNNLEMRLHLQQMFSSDHMFAKQNILWLEHTKEGEPIMTGRLLLGAEWVDKFLFNKESSPKFSPEFPAKRLTSEMTWDDVILNPQTKEEIENIKIWLTHNSALQSDQNLSRKIKPGYRALFYGPPGTGKTLTVSLLGKEFNKEVYRIDLSQVVSKYIGETEKNLEKVFAKAEHKNWILFFDEADALFGKRTSISDAHDKYANQEIAYLLQRLEDYNGLVILSSNMRSNVDEAFGRRLQSIVHFPIPKYPERLRLWQQTFSRHTALSNDVDLEWIAEKFELAGGSIINIVQYVSLLALHRNENIIRYCDILEGIKKEFRKEGKTI